MQENLIRYLDTFVGQVYNCYKNLLQNGTDIGADVIRNEFTGKAERPGFPAEILDAHNTNMEKLIRKG
jgi:hypothetical protein